MRIDRRLVLTGGSVLSAYGMYWPAVLAQTPAAARPRLIADAHTHLFNAADLPAGGFAARVVIPDLWPDMPPFVGAIADFFISVVKQLARPAADEPVRDAGAAFADEVTPELFGWAVGARIETVELTARVDEAVGGEVNLLVSYDALTRILAASIGQPLLYPSRPFAPTLDQRSFLAGQASKVFRAVAEWADEGVKRAGLVASEIVEAGFGDAVRLVGWGWLMCKLRQRHLDQYLRDYTSSAARPVLLINHLVDYDMWLDDGPRARSGHMDQIAFWAKVAANRAGQVELTTFAGFCPLKHAVESAAGQPKTFPAIRKAYRDGQIAGVKVYPPMGFRAAENSKLDDADFTSTPGLGNSAVNAWRKVSADRLGPALDKALADLFAWCRAEDVPIMAHAGPSNQAGKGFALRANPKWWERAGAAHPGLRLSLAHLVHDTDTFLKAVKKLEAGKTLDPDNPKYWAVTTSLRLLNPSEGAGRVYGDLAYMPELVGNHQLAVSFFKALKATYGRADPTLSRILYGTDWIMFAKEPRDADFPKDLLLAMTDAGIGPEAIDNICWNNARRFLKLS